MSIEEGKYEATEAYQSGIPMPVNRLHGKTTTVLASNQNGIKVAKYEDAPAHTFEHQIRVAKGPDQQQISEGTRIRFTEIGGRVFIEILEPQEEKQDESE